MIEELANEDVSNISLNDRGSFRDYRPRLEHKSSYRNLYLAVISNGFNQLMEPLHIEVKVTTEEVKKLCSPIKPTSIDLKWDFKVSNSMDYNVAYSWIMSDEPDNIFGFINCCEFTNMNYHKIRERAIFINSIRKELISEILEDKEALKASLRKSYNLFNTLKNKCASRPNKKNYSVSDIYRKTISSIINEKYEEKFNICLIKHEVLFA